MIAEDYVVMGVRHVEDFALEPEMVEAALGQSLAFHGLDRFHLHLVWMLPRTHGTGAPSSC